MEKVKLKKDEYQGYKIYFYEDKFNEISKKILNKEFKELVRLKDTKRNFVSIIEIDNKKYVYKEPRNEYRIPQRKLMTLFKKGEVLTTLINVNNLINMGFDEFIKPLATVVRRDKRMISFSFLLMEYCEGKEDRNYLEAIIETMKKIHEVGYYHGDFNPGNFLIENGKVRILDTQCKKMFFGNYRAHYDMITMKYDSYDEMIYPYKKNIFYYLAYFIKRYKRLKFIEKIGALKKRLRDKGWKI